MSRMLPLLLCSVLFAGCVSSVSTVRQLGHDPVFVTLDETAKALDLTLEPGEWYGDMIAWSSDGHRFSIRAGYQKYWMDAMPQEIEYPGIRYRDGVYSFPLGMYNSMCLNLGKTELMRNEMPRYTHITPPGKQVAVEQVPDNAAAPATPAAPASAGLPDLKGLRVVIDAGHGGKDPGGIAVTGAHEKDIALAVAKLAGERLRQRGAEVFMTRTGDVFIELADRAGLANSKRANIFVSIHANIAPNSADVTGIETWYDASGSRGVESKALAQALNDAAVAATGANDRGARADQRGLHVLKNTTMAAALVELGFMSNSAEARRLVDAAYQSKCADGIVRGIEAYADSAATVSR